MTDQQGTVKAVVGLHTAEEIPNASNPIYQRPTVLQYFDYDAFGTPRLYNRLDLEAFAESGGAISPTLGNNFVITNLYTGREWDDAAGMYYYRARWYDPLAQRFLSEDPMGFAAGDTNLYRYAFKYLTLKGMEYGRVTMQSFAEDLLKVSEIMLRLLEKKQARR